MGWSHIHVWWIKIQEGCLRSEESQLRNRPFSARKMSPHNFCLLIPVGLSPKQFLLKNPQMDSPTQTHSLWALGMGWQLEGHQ